MESGAFRGVFLAVFTVGALDLFVPIVPGIFGARARSRVAGYVQLGAGSGTRRSFSEGPHCYSALASLRLSKCFASYDESELAAISLAVSLLPFDTIVALSTSAVLLLY